MSNRRDRNGSFLPGDGGGTEGSGQWEGLYVETRKKRDLGWMRKQAGRWKGNTGKVCRGCDGILCRMNEHIRKWMNERIQELSDRTHVCMNVNWPQQAAGGTLCNSKNKPYAYLQGIHSSGHSPGSSWITHTCEASPKFMPLLPISWARTLPQLTPTPIYLFGIYLSFKDIWTDFL